MPVSPEKCPAPTPDSPLTHDRLATLTRVIALTRRGAAFETTAEDLARHSGDLNRVVSALQNALATEHFDPPTINIA
jgi:hypothetical protein